jgi:hypothetical protein
LGQGLGIDLLFHVQQRHALHHVAQLPHVPWPSITLKPRFGPVADVFGGHPMRGGILLQQAARQEEYILPALTQRRQGQDNHRQSMVQVGSEVSRGDALL